MAENREGKGAEWAKYMQDKLDEHSSKGPWSGLDCNWLACRLLDEVEELMTAENREEAMREAADVGNFAFMIAENLFKEEN